MILYSSPLSPFSARVKASLLYKALDFEEVKPSSLGGMASAGFLAVAPLGRIPVLELESGERIAESDAIVEFVEDAFPVPALRPDGAIERARARQLARIAELYIVNRLLWGGPGTRTPLATMMPLAGGRAPLARDAEQIAREGGALRHALDNIARLLSPAGPFALGAAPSTADGALVVYLGFARYAVDYLGIEALQDNALLYQYLDNLCQADAALGTVRQGQVGAMAERRAEIAKTFGTLPDFS